MYPRLTLLLVFSLLSLSASRRQPSFTPEAILESMAEVDVKESWLPVLGILKAAGALGLLIGIGVPVPSIGTAAAVGLVVYFVGAAIVHLHAGDYSISGQHVYLLLAVATLVLSLMTQ
ncbi:DoxX family protein [Halocatena marina]|uniref:DoxX family protein n=1 Tax=Halocatena marina TaxID=2934937 RepID=UPI00360776EB